MFRLFYVQHFAFREALLLIAAVQRQERFNNLFMLIFNVIIQLSLLNISFWCAIILVILINTEVTPKNVTNWMEES